MAKPRLSGREAKSWMGIVGAVVVLRGCIFGHYVIPSGSMQPTLKINDHVLASKLAYGFTWPFGNELVMQWNHPRRGEVVLLKSKESDDILIKRVIGVAGDKIHFVEGRLQINGQTAAEQTTGSRDILADLGEDATDKILIQEKSGAFTKEHSQHFILRLREGGFTAADTRTWQVPDGKVFLMGDNRDGSNDSRFWGYADELNIFARAQWVAFSRQHNAAQRWPPFRTGRFMSSIE